MGREAIYATKNAGALFSVPMLKDLIEFLITNRRFILPEKEKQLRFNSRFSGHSEISDLVHRIVAAGGDKAYGLLRPPSKTVELHEIVDMTFMPFDIAQMRTLVSSFDKSLSLFAELDDKMIINITDITKANGEFSGIEVFHGRVLRDFLSRNYFRSNTAAWISPALVRYVAKVYSIIVAARLRQLFGLTPDTQNFLQGIFCLFFVGKMTSLTSAPDFMLANLKYMGYWEPQEAKQILAFVEDTLGKKAPDSLEDVCKVIHEYGHSQLTSDRGPRITRSVLNSTFSRWSGDQPVSLIALEYPPYFFYLILQAMSGTRNGLALSMNQMKLLKEGDAVVSQLMTNRAFFSTL